MKSCDIKAHAHMRTGTIRAVCSLLAPFLDGGNLSGPISLPSACSCVCRPVNCTSREPTRQLVPGNISTTILSDRIGSNQLEPGWGFQTYPARPDSNAGLSVDQELVTSRLDRSMQRQNGSCFTFPFAKENTVSSGIASLAEIVHVAFEGNNKAARLEPAHMCYSTLALQGWCWQREFEHNTQSCFLPLGRIN